MGRPRARLTADEAVLGDDVAVLQVDVDDLARVGWGPTPELGRGLRDEDVGVQRRVCTGSSDDRWAGGAFDIDARTWRKWLTCSGRLC